MNLLMKNYKTNLKYQESEQMAVVSAESYSNPLKVSEFSALQPDSLTNKFSAQRRIFQMLINHLEVLLSAMSQSLLLEDL